LASIAVNQRGVPSAGGRKKSGGKVNRESKFYRLPRDRQMTSD
jgi:hypothetical protein